MCWIADPRTRRCLEAVLLRLNLDRTTVEPDSPIDVWLGFPSRRLAVYGTLAPGAVNHHQIVEVGGRWESGFVHGDTEMIGWGADYGYAVLTWRPDGGVVPVRVLTADALPLHAARLDDFEGAEYRRTLIPVDGAGPHVVVAQIYTAG